MNRLLITVFKHKWFVLVAGLKVGGIPLLRLLVHDLSKFSLAECGGYSQRYSGNDFSGRRWQLARLHHINHNPHHWQYWVCAARPDLQVIEMPETYVREMVADWMAAKRSYHGHWNIQPWLDERFPKMIFHENTLKVLEQVLKEQKFSLPKLTLH